MNAFVIAILALASCNFLKEEIQRLDAVTKPWQHTTHEENIFRDYTEDDVKALFTLRPDYLHMEDPVVYIKAAENFDSRTQWPGCIHPI